MRILNLPRKTDWWRSHSYLKMGSLTRECQRDKLELRGGTIFTFIANRMNLTFAANGPEQSYPKSYLITFLDFFVSKEDNLKIMSRSISKSSHRFKKNCHNIFLSLLSNDAITMVNLCTREA